MEQKTEQEHEESVFFPYLWSPSLGNCADSDAAKNVSQETYGNEIAFKLAGVTVARHAP